MATKVIEIVKVTLDDGTVIEAKPLKLKLLREFMEEIDAMKNVGTDNAAMLDVLSKCVVIAMKQYAGGSWSIDDVEEKLDIYQVYRIVEGASGIVLDDDSPNQ